MKLKTLAIFGAGILAAILFSGLLTSMIPQDTRADAVNAENLIFTMIDGSDTTAAGDSVLTISAITTSDEIRFAMKIDNAIPDSVVTLDYTDSLTAAAGYVTPATFTYDDDYLIIWRDLNP